MCPSLFGFVACPRDVALCIFNFSASDCMCEASVIFHQIRSLADYLSGGLKKRPCGVWAVNVRVESMTSLRSLFLVTVDAPSSYPQEICGPTHPPLGMMISM